MSKAALYQKIIKVMNEVGQLQKDGDIKDNSGKKMYSYLSEEQTTGELQRAFITHGLVLFPTKVDSEIIYLESMKFDKEVKTPITKVIVTYKICDSETGESEELQSIGYGSDSQDKGSNKAMTGAFKYVQRQTFMISTGEDGDHTSSESLDKQQQPSQPPRATQQPTQTNTQTSQYSASQSQQGGVAMVSDPQVKYIGSLKNQKKVPDDEYRGMIAPKTSTKDLTAAEAKQIINTLQAYVAQPVSAIADDDLPF